MKTVAFLQIGDRFKYWNELGTFVQWEGEQHVTRFGTYRNAQVINSEKRVVIWTMDVLAQVPCR